MVVGTYFSLLFYSTNGSQYKVYESHPSFSQIKTVLHVVSCWVV